MLPVCGHLRIITVPHTWSRLTGISDKLLCLVARCSGVDSAFIFSWPVHVLDIFLHVNSILNLTSMQSVCFFPFNFKLRYLYSAEEQVNVNVRSLKLYLYLIQNRLPRRKRKRRKKRRVVVMPIQQWTQVWVSIPHIYCLHVQVFVLKNSIVRRKQQNRYDVHLTYYCDFPYSLYFLYTLNISLQIWCVTVHHSLCGVPPLFLRFLISSEVLILIILK